MRLVSVFSVILCLLAAIPAHAQLKLKLSGRANTKTVFVEASGMVTATTTNNLAQTETWNGYGDFWKHTINQIFQVTSGITVKNETSGQSRVLGVLEFSNTSSNGDGLSLTSNLMFGGTSHQFSLSGSATFQLQPSQTFAALFEGGTFATENQNPPLGPGPILEIGEAPPADIQVQIETPDGNTSTTGFAFHFGASEVVVRISNVGAGFAENVPYTVTLPPGTYISEASPNVALTGAISFLEPGRSEDIVYYLHFDGGPNVNTNTINASSSFADENPANNSASVTIHEIETGLPPTSMGNHGTTALDLASPTLPSGTQVNVPVTYTCTDSTGPTLIYFTPPGNVYIDAIAYNGPEEPPGMRLFQTAESAVAVMPISQPGTVFHLTLGLHAQNNADGILTATNAPGTPSESTTSRFLSFGGGTPLYKLHGTFIDASNTVDDTPCVGHKVQIDTGNGTLLLTTDLSGSVQAYLSAGPASATFLATGVSFPFTMPSEDIFKEFMASDLDPELEVDLGWEGQDEYTLIIDSDGQIPDATVKITNHSDVPVSNVPVTVRYPNDPNDGDELGFVELENPVTGERTAFSCSFLVQSIAANETVEINVPFHRRPDSQIPDIFGQTITVRAEVDWTDFNVYSDQGDARIMLLDDPFFDSEWTPPGGPVAAGSPVQLTGQLTSNGGSGTATVRVESTVGKILSIHVPGATAAPVNLQNGTLWEFAMPVGAAGSQYPISVFGVVPSNGAANYTIRVLSTGPGIDESSATVAVTGDATPTVLVSGQVFYDANSNGMVDGGERLLPNWPVKVVDGAGHTFHLQADGAGNWGVFVAAGSGPGQASPGAGGGGAPGAGFGFVPLPGVDVDLDVVVEPLELSGRAYVDRDSDAVYTPGTDVPFPGLTTYLGMSSATGQTTTTDADGRYLFTLPPDTPGFLLNPAETGGVARAHIVGLDEPQGFVVPRPIFGVHYVPDFTTGILPLVSTPLNALDFVMGVEPNLVTFDPPTAVNPKIRWPKRLGPGFIPEFNTTLAPNGWMEITGGRTEDDDYYYADLPAAPDGRLFIRLRRPVGTP